MRILSVDDEPLAQAALANIVANRSDVEQFDSANDCFEALEKIEKDNYDVLLLDINMPELSGIELVERLQHRNRPAPSIIFVTAHEQHAVTAFEKKAVDYVLKPYSKDRIDQALDTAFRRTITERAAKLVEILPHLHNLPPRQSCRIAIKNKGRILLIDPHEIVAAQAEGNYVLLLREAGSDLLRESICVIADKLKRYGFIRIHRSVLVNAAFVEEVRPLLTGECKIRLRTGKQYTVSRTYRKNLRSIADLWIGNSSLASNE